MTDEQARKILIEYTDMDKDVDSEYLQAIKVAISSLENNYNSAENNDKLVSQKAVLDTFDEWINSKEFSYSNGLKRLKKHFEELPTIPQTEYEWCKGCKEYDTEKHCCHRYSSFIRESLQENINAVLEEIEEELQTLADDEWNKKVGADKGLECAIEVIDNHISRKE